VRARTIRIALAALVAAGAMGAAGPAAGAQTITVTSTDDPPVGTITVCPAVGSVPCTLRAALLLNDVDGGGDTIVLPPGRYTLTRGLAEQNAVTIAGQGAADATVIDAAGQPGAFVFSPTLGQVPFTLAHLTVQGTNGGPAIAANSVEPLTLDSVILRGNTSALDASGGGLAVNGGTVAIVGSVLADNVTRGDGGGAGIAITNADVTIRDSELRGNHGGAGSSKGAAIYELGSGSLTVARSRLTGNVSPGGGILQLTPASSAVVTVTDSTFDGNGGSPSAGAAIHVDGTSTGSVLAAHDTFLANGDANPTAPGFTFSSAGRITLRDSAVKNAGAACEQAGAVVSGAHNVLDDASCGLAAVGDRQGIDPRLGPLSANGGPTFTALPLPDSPLLDAADAAGCSATDQRGIARPQGAGCDIGAAERSVGVPVVTTGGANGLAVSGTVDPDGQPASVTLEYGRTTKYGNTLQLSALAGWLAQAVGATLKGVAPGALVHYRVVAANASGHAVGADRILRAPSVLSGLHVSPHVVHKKATLTWSLSKAVKVRFTVKIKRHKHWATAARFTLKGKKGGHRRGFPTKTLGHLRAGGYRLEALALVTPAQPAVVTTFRYSPRRRR
jgi:hypothetical protein